MVRTLAVAVVLSGLACDTAGATTFTGSERAVIRSLARDAGHEQGRRAAKGGSDAAKAAVRLGRDLFFDPRLAGNNAWSCATCHQPARGWSDGESTPSRFPQVKRNTQTIWDVASERSFFWDGRVSKLWRQALEPLESAKEMQGHRLKTALLIFQDRHLLTDYSAGFGAPRTSVFRDVEQRAAQMESSRPDDWDRAYRSLSIAGRAGVDMMFVNVGKALASFQERLTSGFSRFDRFAREWLRSGRSNALSAEEQSGLKLFVRRNGCVSCHSGTSFSDGRLHAAMSGADEGQAPARPRPGHAELSAAAGRDPQDGFKTPRLRNVTLTAPYMHDGSLSSLEDVMRRITPEMRHGDGRTAGLSPGQQASIVAFLATLTDERHNRRDPGGLYAVEAWTQVP